MEQAVSKNKKYDDDEVQDIDDLELDAREIWSLFNIIRSNIEHYKLSYPLKIFVILFN